MSRELDPTVRLSDVEALLAIVIAHHEEQISAIRGAVGIALHALGADACRDACSVDHALQLLFPEPIGSFHRAKESPFPVHWLRSMAERRCSVAQVAWNREDAADRMRQALERA